MIGMVRDGNSILGMEFNKTEWTSPPKDLLNVTIITPI